MSPTDIIHLRNLSVLIVDDIANMRRLLADVLRGLGAGATHEAESMILGLGLLMSGVANLALVDIELGGENGLDLVRQIRAHPSRDIAVTPIVVVTAHGTARRVSEARKAGADAFLVKPISVRRLADGLAVALRGAGSGLRASP